MIAKSVSMAKQLFLDAKPFLALGPVAYCLKKCIFAI